MGFFDLGKLVQDTVKGASDTLGGLADQVGKAADELNKGVQSFLQPEEKPVVSADLTCLPVRSALKLIYYLIAADSKIEQSELAMLDSIGHELMPDFDQQKETIIEECTIQIGKAASPEMLRSLLQESMTKELLIPRKKSDPVISSRHLLWNLLSTAYADGEYASSEAAYLQSFVRVFELDPDLFAEMEDSFLAASEIEQQLAWVKTLDEPWRFIEGVVRELETRRQVILQSGMDLILLQEEN